MRTAGVEEALGRDDSDGPCSDSQDLSAQFNWAAFLLPWAWYFANGLWRVGLLFLLGPFVIGGVFALILVNQPDVVAIPMRWLIRDVGWTIASAVFAFRANRLALARLSEARIVDDYRLSQRRWERWAVLFAISVPVLYGAAFAILEYTVLP